ncbi:MAG: hypothetical protein QM674_08780 [Burkholderiaceae bacterium]
MATKKPQRMRVSDAVDLSSLPDAPGTWGDDLVNPFATQQSAPASEGPGVLRSIGDSAVALGRGAITGVRMLSDAAGADNPVSGKLRQAEQFVSSLESPPRQAERAERAQKIKAAAESGSTAEEIAAYLGSFTEAPVDTLLEAFGTSLPTLAAAVVNPPAGIGAGAAKLLQVARMMGVGAVQGAGAAKSQIYDSVRQGLTEQGMGPAEAQARAAQAQSYGGENKDQIGLGAALGAAAGRFGIEASAARMAGGQAGRGAILRRAARGFAAEGLPEAAQGGQEQLAGNVAQQREGLDVPTMQGVAGSAALEGVAGGGLGSAMGAVESTLAPPPGSAPPPAPAAPDGPLTRAARAAATGGIASRVMDAVMQPEAQAGPRPAAATAVDPAAGSGSEPVASAPADEFAEPLDSIRQALRAGLTEEIRNQIGPQAASQALETLALAENPNTPRAVRADAVQALQRLTGQVGERASADWQVVGDEPAAAPLQLESNRAGQQRLEGPSPAPQLTDTRTPVMVADEQGNIAPATAEMEAQATTQRTVDQIRAEEEARRRRDLGMDELRMPRPAQQDAAAPPAIAPQENANAPAQRSEPTAEDQRATGGASRARSGGPEPAGVSAADELVAAQRGVVSDQRAGFDLGAVAQGQEPSARGSDGALKTDRPRRAEPVDVAPPSQRGMPSRPRFASVDEVVKHLSAMRREGGRTPKAKPVVTEDGEFTFAIQGEREYDELPDARGRSMTCPRWSAARRSSTVSPRSWPGRCREFSMSSKRFSDVGEMLAEYDRRFGNRSPQSHRLACNLGANQTYYGEVDKALAEGKPIDFNALATKMHAEAFPEHERRAENLVLGVSPPASRQSLGDQAWFINEPR